MPLLIAIITVIFHLSPVRCDTAGILECADYRAETIEPIDLHQVLPPHIVQEDEQGWDCTSMGDLICGDIYIWNYRNSAIRH